MKRKNKKAGEKYLSGYVECTHTIQIIAKEKKHLNSIVRALGHTLSTFVKSVDMASEKLKINDIAIIVEPLEKK